MTSPTKNSTRVAYLPTTVAGHPIALSEAIASMGFEVRLWQLEGNSFGYGKYQSIFKSQDKFFTRELKRLRALVSVLAWADVIHCTFGTTLAGNTSNLPSNLKGIPQELKFRIVQIYENMFLNLELTLYKFFDKTLVIDYQGDDIRQRKFQLENYEHSIAHVVDSDYYTTNSDLKKKKRLKKFKKYGFKIYALNPDLLNYLPYNALFVPYSNVELVNAGFGKELPQERPLIFVHAPSKRSVKGTESIIQVFTELKNEGLPVELRLVEGTKNSEALKIYGEAQFAIDQLNAGWYGGFSVECMAQGIPVMSYIRESDLGSLPIEMRDQLPVINSCVCSLKNDSLNIISLSSSDYKKLSKACIDYVNTWHDPNQVAVLVAQSYEKHK